MKIATWNVNSVRARTANITEWLSAAAPDVLVLQEIKCETEQFPLLEFTALGYQCSVIGQKSYNGVAALTKAEHSVVLSALPGGDDDFQSRYIEIDVEGVRVIGIYLPNGNPVFDEAGGHTYKFQYKIKWMDRLIARAEQLLREEVPFMILGDYNVCPLDIDCYDAQRLAGDALLQPESRQRWHQLANLGLTDAFRAAEPGPDPKPAQYSYWDYTGGALDKDNGLRIDHVMLSPPLADRLEACVVDRKPRAAVKASDHTPVICTLRSRP